MEAIRVKQIGNATFTHWRTGEADIMPFFIPADDDCPDGEVIELDDLNRVYSQDKEKSK